MPKKNSANNKLSSKSLEPDASPLHLFSSVHLSRSTDHLLSHHFFLMALYCWRHCSEKAKQFPLSLICFGTVTVLASTSSSKEKELVFRWKGQIQCLKCCSCWKPSWFSLFKLKGFLSVDRIPFVLFEGWLGTDLHLKMKKRWRLVGQIVVKDESRSYHMLTERCGADRPAATSDVWLSKGLTPIPLWGVSFEHPFWNTPDPKHAKWISYKLSSFVVLMCWEGRRHCSHSPTWLTCSS